VPQAALQLVRIRPGGIGQPEGESVAQIMRPQRADVALRVGVLGVMEAPDPFQDGVHGSPRQSSVLLPAAHGRRRQPQRSRYRPGVAWSFPLQIVGQRVAGVGRQEHGPLRAAHTTHADQPGSTGDPQVLGIGRLELIEVNADQFLAAQPRREQHEDDGAVPPRAHMRMDRHRTGAGVALAALHQGKPFQPIAQVLQRPHLRIGQGPRLKRRQRQPRQALGRIPGSEHPGRLGGDPRGEPGQRGEMIVHRRRRQPGYELALPSRHVASRHSRDAIVTVGLSEAHSEPLQVQGDLGRHLLRAHPGDASARYRSIHAARLSGTAANTLTTDPASFREANLGRCGRVPRGCAVAIGRVPFTEGPFRAPNLHTAVTKLADPSRVTRNGTSATSAIARPRNGDLAGASVS
jgi:hypothetical protein